jgi:ABC-type multidrug transport system ATPase subunit
MACLNSSCMWVWMTSGVDPVARRQFWDLLYELANRGVALFVTTRYMEEASHCNQLAFIYRGRLIAEGSPPEIRGRARGSRSSRWPLPPPTRLLR